MNVERLHTVVYALDSEMTEHNSVGNLQNIVGALKGVVSQPQNASHQQSLSNGLRTIREVLTAADSDDFSPAWRQTMRDLGCEPYFGALLKETIDGIFSRNQITPAVALDELQRLLTRMQEFKGALEMCLTAFKKLEIGDESLAPGNCEIGILIPRNAVKNQMLGLSKEFKEFEFILNVFSEVATGKKDDLAVRTISSSDFMVFVDAAAPFGACVAVAIERVVSLYKQLLEIRRIRNDLTKQGVPSSQTKGIEDHANSLMERGIEKVSVELVEKFYHGKDAGRRNELTVSVRIALSRLANRIDRGFNVEVRVEPLPENSTPPDQQLAKAVGEIQSATPKMQFLRAEGEPILHLTEASEEKKTKGKTTG